MGHSPLPWSQHETEPEFIRDYNGVTLIYTSAANVPERHIREGNADLICEAVNNFDRIKDENERLREALKVVSRLVEASSELQDIGHIARAALNSGGAS